MIGILLVDKPRGMTSHDVVDRIRRAARMRRIGHTGTLDPSATGLLILCLGQATRLSEHLTGLDKCYEGVMRLGVITDSHDLDGRVVEERAVPELSREDIQKVCDSFTGEIQQIPPMVSAVKIGGERLYKKARKGEEVERKPRRVTVSEFTVSSYTPPEAHLRVACTRGTYVRSLCHDVGQTLGCGAALATLRRVSVGRHSVTDAHTLEELDTQEAVRQHLLPMGVVLDLPEVVVLEAGRAIIATGGVVGEAQLEGGCPVREGWVQVKSSQGELIALATVERSAAGAYIHPKRVLCA